MKKYDVVMSYMQFYTDGVTYANISGDLMLQYGQSHRGAHRYYQIRKKGVLSLEYRVIEAYVHVFWSAIHMANLALR